MGRSRPELDQCNQSHTGLVPLVFPGCWCVFFLHAHWSGPINGHGRTPTPSVQSCPESRTSPWESFHGEGGFSPEK